MSSERVLRRTRTVAKPEDAAGLLRIFGNEHDCLSASRRSVSSRQMDAVDFSIPLTPPFEEKINGTMYGGHEHVANAPSGDDDDVEDFDQDSDELGTQNSEAMEVDNRNQKKRNHSEIEQAFGVIGGQTIPTTDSRSDQNSEEESIVDQTSKTEPSPVVKVDAGFGEHKTPSVLLGMVQEDSKGAATIESSRRKRSSRRATSKKGRSVIVPGLSLIGNQKNSPTVTDLDSSRLIGNQKNSPTVTDLDSSSLIGNQKNSPTVTDLDLSSLIGNQKNSPTVTDLDSSIVKKKGSNHPVPIVHEEDSLGSHTTETDPSEGDQIFKAEPCSDREEHSHNPSAQDKSSNELLDESEGAEDNEIFYDTPERKQTPRRAASADAICKIYHSLNSDDLYDDESDNKEEAPRKVLPSKRKKTRAKSSRPNPKYYSFDDDGHIDDDMHHKEHHKEHDEEHHEEHDEEHHEEQEAMPAEKRQRTSSIELHYNDVLDKSRNHPGNSQYLKICEKLTRAGNKSDLMATVKAIIDEVGKLEPPGRFLFKRKENYELMSAKQIEMKVSRCVKRIRRGINLKEVSEEHLASASKSGEVNEEPIKVWEVNEEPSKVREANEVHHDLGEVNERLSSSASKSGEADEKPLSRTRKNGVIRRRQLPTKHNAEATHQKEPQIKSSETSSIVTKSQARAAEPNLNSEVQVHVVEEYEQIVLHKNDVNHSAKHYGTSRYMQKCREVVRDCPENTKINDLAETVLQEVVNQKPPGRFLVKSDGRYKVMDHNDIIGKIKSAITHQKQKLRKSNEDIRLSTDESTLKVQDNDVLHDSCNHSGTRQYFAICKEFIRTHPEDVESLDETAKAVIAKVLKLTPPGRFLCQKDGKYEVMDDNEMHVQVSRYLHEQRKIIGTQIEVQQTDSTIQRDELSIELHDNDVLHSVRNHPGSKRFRKFCSECANDASSNDDRVIAILQKVYAQQPPGRFIRKENQHYELLSDDEIQKQVRNAIRNYKARLRQISKSSSPAVVDDSMLNVENISVAKNISVAQDEAVRYETHLTDVLGGSEPLIDSNPGNKLFRDLIEENAERFDTDFQTSAITEILSKIKRQEPPGRFLSPNNDRSLSQREARSKVWQALFERCYPANSHKKMLETSMASSDKSKEEADSTCDPKPTENNEIVPELSRMNESHSTCDDLRTSERGSDVEQGNAVGNDLISREAEEEKKEERAIESESNKMRDQQARVLGPYVEDFAWRKFVIESEEFEDLHPLPPPADIPRLPDSRECCCDWNFDEGSRVLRVTLRPGVDRMSKVERDFLLLMMERDDIAVVTAGHCQDLSSDLWSLGAIKYSTGDTYHHRFRRFHRTIANSDDNLGEEAASKFEYEEVDQDLVMSVASYLEYLENRKELLKCTPKHSTLGDEVVKREYKFKNENGEDVTLDLLNDVVYMLDYDFKKKLPTHYEDFKRCFSLPECLPGGSMCMMNAINESARPDMGPNLYITPPGSFTRFHQDGYGTVDSGHLALAGYNEVVIFRRLPRGHDRHAIDVDGNKLYEMPHSDKLGKKTAAWPTKERMKKLNDLNYCAISLILGPGELMHIGKGRFHAFRKLGHEKLPENDCHFDLRNEVHTDLQKKGIQIDQLVNISLAWDWSFRGVSPEGINREMASTLEFALRNRMFEIPKQSLAIPKICLIRSVENALSVLEGKKGDLFGLSTKCRSDSINPNVSIIRGLLPALQFVVTQEEEAYKIAESTGALAASERSWPNSWENSVTFPLDPYGSDYFCRTCLQELPNTYMHCSGCEELLGKDFNICSQCHQEGRQKDFYVMNAMHIAHMDSTLNHTGCFHSGSCKCETTVPCSKCTYCRKCSCTCHGAFTLQQRMWTSEKLAKLIRDATRILAINNCQPVKFFDEVGPRLREASLAKDLTKLYPKEHKVPTRSAHRIRQSTHQVFHLPIFAHCEPFSPMNFLDISPPALAFTAPPPGNLTENIGGGSRFEASYFYSDKLVQFIESARVDGGKELVESGDPAEVMLYRNFVDCEKIFYDESTMRYDFTPREQDIIAFAFLQARNKVEIKGKGGKLINRWSVVAHTLMSYRVRKDFLDKFYHRSSSKSNLVDKYVEVLGNEQYRQHLQERIKPLFDFAYPVALAEA